MRKKIIISLLIIFLLAIAGSIFWWWQNQQATAGLNKTLPDGVRVEKSLIGEDYWVKNKIDGYEFRTPRAWGGIEEVEYIADREAEGFKGTSIFIMGKMGQAKTISIDAFDVDKNKQLKEWAQYFFNTFDLTGTFDSVEIGNFDAIKTNENKHLGGAYIYFIENNRKNYVFTGGSEEFIREIILNGKW